MAQASKGDLPDGESEKFFATGLDRHFADLPVGQITAEKAVASYIATAFGS
jgi:hypothetical protein